ncbi:MAG TPA: hypothetical protein VJ838_15775 [Gaiellaceae bacterium]|nr:hypothetical protein [Gaiellaceae bacterium]
MDDLRTRAQLVEFDRAGAIGTVVSRAEIAEAAAGNEFPATLLLDLERDDAAQATVAVDWDQKTLEQLLASIEEQEIGLWFDESELSLAFDEVEGHGLRQRAAVLAVAVTAAGVSSAPAFARMQAGPGGGGSVAPTAVVAPNPAGDKAAVMQGAERALQQDAQVSQNLGSANAAATSTSEGSTLSTGELAGAIGGGALLIAAAGFGVSRRRTPPAQPA